MKILMLLLSPDGEDLLFLAGSITRKKEESQKVNPKGQSKPKTSPVPKIQSNPNLI